MENNVIVRFAPSPTGPLHIGGVRTALFNYLFAKKHGGTMLLRIEDTDQNRYVPGAEEYIKEALEWCGIELDESPWNPGDRGPYRQSERKDMYAEYAEKMVKEGKAYYAFDTPEELSALRDKFEKEKGESFLYNAVMRNRLKNSLTMSAAEVQEKIESGEPYVIRLKVPIKKEIRLKDMIRGWVVVHSHTIDDKILLKADGMPTYHLANIVDDHLMGVTHVIRGEEWLPSAPLHVLLYEFLGWANEMPEFAHLPLLLKPSGKGKLSKRDGDKLGFSVFPLQWTDPENGQISSGYREDGFLADAFTNFLAMLGWSSGTDQEIYTKQELIEAFSIERISKSGAKFDFEKAKWFNQQYLKNYPVEKLTEKYLETLKKEGIECDFEKAKKITSLMQERVVFPAEIYTSAKFFFEVPEEYDQKIAKKKWNAEVVDVFTDYAAAVKSADNFDETAAKDILVKILEEKGIGMGKVMQSLRLATTGVGGGPDLMPVLEVLGKDEVASRINIAIEKLSSFV